ncbi:hypothetical protein [Nocardia sp. NBC_01388]|uniref:hypothetical protein n=1 Tax=Nocardia sp. NBC_01388 TaxID=2903596 RepID=UPI0032438F18
MTPEEIRAEAAQRIAKAEHARLYPGMPWEKVRAEDLVWLLEEAAAVVDALGDMLPTGAEGVAVSEQPADGTLFAGEPGGSEYRCIDTLADPYAEITQNIMGTGRYWAGSIFAADVSREAFNALSMGCVWVVWAGVFMRINGAGNSSPGPGGRLWRIECSQRQHVGYVELGRDPVALDLIEPSPPMPPESWWMSECARAVRDLVGTEPRPDRVFVPDMRGKLAQIDPWEVTE